MPIEFLDRLPELERQAQEHEQKAQALRKIIEGVRALNGDAEHYLGGGIVVHAVGSVVPSADEPIPRGRDVVRRIMASRPGIWRVRDIKAEAKRRGWFVSASAIEAAVQRLAADDEIQLVKKGYYRFDPNGSHSSGDDRYSEVKPDPD